MSNELDPESGAENATEAALLATRPRRGAAYERANAASRQTLDTLVASGHMSQLEIERAAEVLLDISWLAAEGHISLDEMRARTLRVAERRVALIRARAGEGKP